ncbi:DUSAM domain-containing protein [Archangium sp.]|uniref:DUSAM domain-containing protein n=1 Tax=Archangium sp. TaxID=1872627 RepID=UPI00286C8A26|nr:DUSAM domain-containing protein [Archangium sp.]
MTEETDWDELRALARQVLDRDAPLEITDETRALLTRTAQQVAIRPQDAEDALRSASTATTLLREIRQRIRDGGIRYGDALHRAYRLRDKGDLDGARQQMRDVLSVEVVPFYRERAEMALEDMDAGAF